MAVPAKDVGNSNHSDDHAIKKDEALFFASQARPDAARGMRACNSAYGGRTFPCHQIVMRYSQ